MGHNFALCPFLYLPLGCYSIYIPPKSPFEKGGLVATLPMVGAAVATDTVVKSTDRYPKQKG